MSFHIIFEVNKFYLLFLTRTAIFKVAFRFHLQTQTICADYYNSVCRIFQNMAESILKRDI